MSSSREAGLAAGYAADSKSVCVPLDGLRFLGRLERPTLKDETHAKNALHIASEHVAVRPDQ